MTMPREVIFDPIVALTVGFIGMMIVICIWLVLTTCRPWHRIFHANRGINRAYSCDHCWNDYTRRW